MVDLNNHPLSGFFLEVVREYEVSARKYSPWENENCQWQMDAVKSEMLEVEAAMLKDDGGAKELIELPQLANVCGKRYMQIRRPRK